MKHLWLPAVLLVLACGCGDDNSLNSTDDLTLQEQGEDAAVVAAEAVALDSGGLLESLEAVLLGDVEGGDGVPAVVKDRASDEAVFDSSSCTWTITQARGADHGESGFNWTQTRTLHFMDESGGCIVQRGDSLIRSLDFTRAFSGESWNPRRESQKSGGGAWSLTSLHDAEPGSLANGEHAEQGEGLVHRVRPNGEVVDVATSYTLAIEGTDLLLLHRNGRRVPVAGTLHVVYDAVRNGHEIHREFTITFGEGGGTIDLGEGQVYAMDPVTGEVNL